MCEAPHPPAASISGVLLSGGLGLLLLSLFAFLLACVFTFDELYFKYGALSVIYVGEAVGRADGQALINALIVVIVSGGHVQEELQVPCVHLVVLHESLGQLGLIHGRRTRQRFLQGGNWNGLHCLHQGDGRGLSELFVLHLRHDLAEDAVDAFPEVAHAGLVPAVLGDDLKKRCLGDLDPLVLRNGRCRRLLAGGMHETVLRLETWDQIVLSNFDLFDGEVGGDMYDLNSI